MNLRGRSRTKPLWQLGMTSNKIRTLIVDDVAATRRAVQTWLEKDSEVLIVGLAATGAEAVRLLRSEKPDLVFLKVQLPDLNGFKILDALDAQTWPAVVFCTKDDAHALEAFEVNAVDYLITPCDAERFGVALRRAKAEIARRQTDALASKLHQLIAHLQGNLEPTRAQAAVASERAAAVASPSSEQESVTRERILLRSGGEIFFLKAEDVDWIEAEGDYMNFHAAGRAHPLRETMSNLEARLDPKRFVRIHRSTIVNIDRVKKLSPSFAGEYAVILHDGTKLRLSRGYHDRLQELMQSVL